MKKRLLSILLALCMVLALLPSGTAFAEEFEPYSVGSDTEIAEDMEPGTEEDGVMPIIVDDHTPPVVTGVTMNNPGGTVTVGDKLYFSVSTEDESGIEMWGSYLSFTFTCAQKHRHTVSANGSRGGIYDEDAKQAKFELTVTEGMLNGTYTLSGICIWDTYGNETYYNYGNININFDDICFTVEGSSATEDHEPPTVTAISMEEPGKIVTVGDTLYFTVSAEDESGIEMWGSYLSFTFICAQEHRHTVSANGSRGGIYDEDAKQAKFELTITEGMLNGTYTLSGICIWDTYGNETYYNYGNININFDDICFTVEGSSATEDHEPPTVTAISMEEPGKIVTVGDTLYFTVSAEDESGIEMWGSYLSFTFICAQEHRHTVSANGSRGGIYDEDAKQAKFELTITEGMLNGTYTLSGICIWDTYGNETYYNYGNIDIDFDAIYFVIATPDIEPTDVSIQETLSLPVRTAQTVYPTVTPADSIPNWTWVSASTNIAEAAKVESGKACLITGVSPGTTTITGTTQNGLTAVCTVTVTDAPLPESGSIEESYQVGVGGFVDIEPVLTPEDATTLYEATSDNPHVAGIALVNGGTAIRIQGNNPGTATITIRGANNLIMTTTVRVGKETDIQHEKMSVPDSEPTCGWPGWKGRVVCSACWYVFSGEEIPATGKHTWGAWQVVQAATSTTAGSRERYCVNCGEHETQAIPATGSSTPSRPGTSGGSGGSSGGSSGTLPSPNSPGNVTSDGQNVQASVKDGTAEITNSDKNISDILDGAENGTVHIDTSANKDVTEVSIPKGVMDAITENGTVSAVSITTSAGTVELHEEALNTISNAMTGSNDTISLEVKTIDADTIPSTQKYPIADVLNSAVFINLSATIQHRDASGRTTSTETIHEFGGSVTVSVPFEMPANMEGRQIIACHIADDGSITYFPVKYENGVATFTTTHFSLFALVESRAAAFADINVSAWYMPSVEYVLNRGLMGDAGNQRFDPNGATTRGMIMTILARLDGVDTSGSGPWYQKGMEWAVQAGVSDGTNPGGNITREQLAVMLWRYADEPTVTGSLDSYSDAGIVHDWADTAMVWAVQNGIITGSGGKLNPRGNATRVQAAAMLTRFCQNIEK